ncbi:MAG: acyl-ACP--UDP-N-acetylglucosamine O-acyltransferase [Alphaproteobacteria bacterium]
MSQNIHATAIIESGAVIGENVIIGAYSVIGGSVKIADGCQIKSHVCIDGDTDIGESCTIFPFASIGHAPQDLKYAGEKTQLIIGRNNRIREHVTMNPGTVSGGGKTVVGDNNLFMMGAHIAHDCILGNNVIMANNATLGGHVEVGNFVVIGGLSAVHQFVRIGDYAIIGGFSGVESDVIPYGRVKGERAHLAGLNLIGLERQGFSKEAQKNLQKAFNQLFGIDGTLEQRLESVENDFSGDETVQKIIQFAKAKTKFPLCQPAKRA